MNKIEFSASCYKLRILLTVLLALLFIVPGFAIAGYVGDNIAISDKAYDQQNPHTIYLPDKDLWFVVWEDWRDFTSTSADIRGQFINADGALCGDEIVIANPTCNQTMPRAAYRNGDLVGDPGDDKIVVAWSDTRANFLYYTTITSFPDPSNCAAYTPPAPSSGTQIGFNPLEIYSNSTLTTANVSDEVTDAWIPESPTTGWSLITVSGRLMHTPVVPGKVKFVVNDLGSHPKNIYDTDSSVTFNYNTGDFTIVLNDVIENQYVHADYDYYTSFPPSTTTIGDSLTMRQKPKIVYDKTNDRFWIVWIEKRNTLQNISELCFGFVPVNWQFGDSNFIGYVRLNGSDLGPQPSEIGVTGPDIIRRVSNPLEPAGTTRLISSSIDTLKEIREYESFRNLNNVDISCDDTSGECFIAFEGIRDKQTLTCDCTDRNSNKICDLADIVTSKLDPGRFTGDDPNVHIFGIFHNYIAQPVVLNTWIDNSSTSNSYYPSVGIDPITKRFLVAWEDLRGGSNTKIYGQLVYSGGGLYNNNFIISYEDTDGINGLDPNVANSKQTKPFISYDPVNQRFFVVWQDGRNSTLSLENLDIYGQKVDAEGSLRGYNFAVFTLPYNQYNPTIAYNDVMNQFLAVWKDARNTDQRDCSLTGTPPWNKPCGSDVYGQIFTLGQPSLTLLKMDNTPLTPPLLSGFEMPKNPDPFSVKSVEVGLFDSQSFKIRNTGDTILKIDYIDETCKGTIASIDPFSFDGLPSQLTARYDDTIDLVPSAELPLTVRFTPLAGGSYNKCFIIESDGGNPQVNLSALAIESNITIAPALWNFGPVFTGSFGEKTFVVKNTGTATLRITTVDSPLVPFTIFNDGCSSAHDLTPGSTCNIVVRFTPIAASPPPFSSSFNINSNDPDTPTLNVPLSGTGVGAPKITVTPPNIDFGNVQVGDHPQQTITIKNAGTEVLTLNSISSTVVPFSIVSNSCSPVPFTLAMGNSCQVIVKFAPTLAGVSSSSITISSDDPDEGTVNISLNGTGILLPNINLSTTMIDFHSVPVASSAQRTLTVSNTGGLDLNIISVTKPISPFSILNDSCSGKTLAYNATCSITIVFNPTFDGIFYPYYMTILSNDPDEPTVQVTLKGETGILQFSQISGLTADAPALAWNAGANKMQMVVRASNDTLWASTFNSSGVFNNDWVNIPGLTASAPALAWNPVTNKMQMVVRASNNTLWASTFNSSGVFNNDWVNIPGLTADAPALAWNPLANKMQLAVRGSDGSSIWTATFNSSGVFNNDWVHISGAMASFPALAWNQGTNEMQLVVRASNSTIWESTFNSSGVFNNDWVNVPGMTADAPALAWNAGANEMQMVVRASDGTIWASTFNSSGVFNNDWFNIPGITADAPALAWNPVASEMQIVVRASNNTLWIIMY